MGEKAHKILSWQLKAEETANNNNAIQTETGSISYSPTEINDTFKHFYSKLYKSELPQDLTHIDNFLSKVELQKICEEDKKNLDLPFMQAEIIKALNSLQSNKSPGEDGFPPEFCIRNLKIYSLH